MHSTNYSFIQSLIDLSDALSLIISFIHSPIRSIHSCISLIHSLILCCGVHYETYIGISPYRTLAVDLSTMYGSIITCVTWSHEKIQTLFIFRAICENTAHVQWIRCSPLERLTPYSLNECCIFPHRIQINTVCISYHSFIHILHQWFMRSIHLLAN